MRHFVRYSSSAEQTFMNRRTIRNLILGGAYLLFTLLSGRYSYETAVVLGVVGVLVFAFWWKRRRDTQVILDQVRASQERYEAEQEAKARAPKRVSGS